MDVPLLEALLPMQVDVVTADRSGQSTRSSTLLTPLTNLDLTQPAASFTAAVSSMRVEQPLPAGVWTATAQVYVLHPQLGLIQASEPTDLLFPVATSIAPMGGGHRDVRGPGDDACPEQCEASVIRNEGAVLRATAAEGWEFHTLDRHVRRRADAGLRAPAERRRLGRRRVRRTSEHGAAAAGG